MSLKSIHPPESASKDEFEFAKWVQNVGNRLLHAGIDVHLIPMVSSDEKLFLGIDVSDDVARVIKRALYN